MYSYAILNALSTSVVLTTTTFIVFPACLIFWETLAIGRTSMPTESRKLLSVNLYFNASHNLWVTFLLLGMVIT